MRTVVIVALIFLLGAGLFLIWFIRDIQRENVLTAEFNKRTVITASKWNRFGRALGCQRDTGIENQPIAEAMESLTTCLEQERREPGSSFIPDWAKGRRSAAP